MRSIQNELEGIEESGYAKFLAIEITRARYALQVSVNSLNNKILRETERAIPPAA